MKQKLIFGLLTILVMILSVIGICTENLFLEKAGEMLILFPLAGYYFKDLPSKNVNLYLFFIFAFCAIATSGISGRTYMLYINLGLWLATYIILVREAIKHTEYEKGNKFTTLYFLAVVAIYVYMLSLHIMEIERSLADNLTLVFYILYYLNILFLAVTAIIYHLNSFSKKSVFFLCLTLSFIFADVLRDMEVFYFPDVSVEIVSTLIRFAALKLVFLFFITKEKKLRLLHLV
jgi:hypothetical protein